MEHLLAAGLIQLDPWPELRWPELRPVVLASESAGEFARWQRDASKGAWRTVRVPLFVLLMVLVAWLTWAAGGSMKAMYAILLASVAFLGQLAQLFNFARTGGTTPAKSGS